MSNESVYQKLSSVNVENFVKGKNGFRFLSWSHAVDQLLKHYPKATWKIREFESLPYLQTKGGCFVEVSVTIEDVTRSQLHPILDFRNQAIKEPNAFQVNTSIQRALAKAISLHGLGLYIYQGEDLPLSEKDAIDESRKDLINLLKENGKFSTEAEHAVNKMSYEQLQNKITEYRNK